MKTELIPVIHAVSEGQVLKNIDTCLAEGIEKVFLVNHAISSLTLLNYALTVREKIWTGINLLDKSVQHMLSMDWNFDAVWVDGTVKKDYDRVFSGMVFGGLAFKYQPQPTDLKMACEEAVGLTDVATTSGAGTGKAADVEKIHLIREYLGKHPMAIASGVSAENVKDYAGIADYLLVASSFTDHKEMIIPEKLKELVEQL